jgi:hypothetical protein
MEDYEIRVFWKEILEKLFETYRRDRVVADVPPSCLEEIGLDSLHY